MDVWSGTYGAGNFENETALDWVVDFASNDFRLIDRTLAGVAGMVDADELDAEEAREVLAAAECVAAAGGFPTDELPLEVEEWLEENAPIQLKPEYVTMARKAVMRVQSQSELRDIWAETEHFALWESAVADLQARLDRIKP